MIQEIKVNPSKLSDYKEFVDRNVYEEIESLARDLKGVNVAHLNTSATGGGVAEILRCLIPLINDVGLDANWYLGREGSKFFSTTKEIHNFLQGKKGDLTENQKEIYLKANERMAKHLSSINADIWVIHDPQFVAAIKYLPTMHPAVWRCHIDNSHPNLNVWNFLLPYLQEFDHYIFTIRKYLGPGLNYEKTRVIPPAIDPLNEKNNPLSQQAADDVVSRFGIVPSNPLISQISRFDPWKDPWGVIDAYRLAKKEIPNYCS